MNTCPELRISFRSEPSLFTGDPRRNPFSNWRVTRNLGTHSFDTLLLTHRVLSQTSFHHCSVFRVQNNFNRHLPVSIFPVTCTRKGNINSTLNCTEGPPPFCSFTVGPCHLECREDDYHDYRFESRMGTGDLVESVQWSKDSDRVMLLLTLCPITFLAVITYIVVITTYILKTSIILDREVIPSAPGVHR